MGKSGKEILVNNGDRKELRRLLNVSYPTIRMALQYKSKTALAHKIRETAIKRGGIVVVSQS